MREEVLEILSEIRPDVDFENAKQLIDDGILDSFDIMSIVGELNDVFNITIRPKDLIPANFNTLDSICEMINSLSK